MSELLDPVIKGNRSAIERHHLFPRAYLERLGVTETRTVNQIANFALVEWDENGRIADEPPSRYFPENIRDLSSSDLSQMRYWHALPQGWENMEYQHFLEERRSAMARVIHDGYHTLLN